MMRVCIRKNKTIQISALTLTFKMDRFLSFDIDFFRGARWLRKVCRGTKTLVSFQLFQGAFPVELF